MTRTPTEAEVELVLLGIQAETARESRREQMQAQPQDLLNKIHLLTIQRDEARGNSAYAMKQWRRAEDEVRNLSNAVYELSVTRWFDRMGRTALFCAGLVVAWLVMGLTK